MQISKIFYKSEKNSNKGNFSPLNPQVPLYENKLKIRERGYYESPQGQGSAGINPEGVRNKKSTPPFIPFPMVIS